MNIEALFAWVAGLGVVGFLTILAIGLLLWALVNGAANKASTGTNVFLSGAALFIAGFLLFIFIIIGILWLELNDYQPLLNAIEWIKGLRT